MRGRDSTSGGSGELKGADKRGFGYGKAGVCNIFVGSRGNETSGMSSVSLVAQRGQSGDGLSRTEG